MQKLVKILAVTTSLYAVTACSSVVKDTLGFTRSAPDEFRIVSNAPLSVPPEFTLRPPLPGAKRPQDTAFRDQAKNILFENSGTSQNSGSSAGESILLQKANIQDANPDIRTILMQEELNKNSAEKKKGFWGKVASATNLKSTDEPAINPTKEKERIEKNSQEGKAANEGDVPVVDGTKKPLLKRVFGF